MFNISETFQKIKNKGTIFNKPSFILSYFILSIMAGLFISLGSMMMLSSGALLTISLFKPFIMAGVFSFALLAIVFAGGELFTGQCMYQTARLLDRHIESKKWVRNLSICWLGNLIGCILCALLFSLTEPNSTYKEAINIIAITKTNLPLLALFVKGIFCNIFVCLALWMSNRITESSTKVPLIVLSVFGFVLCGFEHSIANMFILSTAYILGSDISFIDILYNLLVVTSGNIVGGMLLVYSYWLVNKNL